MVSLIACACIRDRSDIVGEMLFGFDVGLFEYCIDAKSADHRSVPSILHVLTVRSLETTMADRAKQLKRYHPSFVADRIWL